MRRKEIEELLHRLHAAHSAANAVHEIGKEAQALANIAGFIPLLGGGLSGLLDPAQGASRAETAAIGGGGGLLGGLLGAAAGGYLTADPEGVVSLPAVAGGAALGTGLGSMLGRWLVKRNPSRQEEEIRTLRRLIRELNLREGGGGGREININLGGLPAGASAAREA